MKSQLTFTPEVLTCCTLDNYCDYYYYLTMLVIYEHLNILAMFCYNLHPVQPEEDFFLGFGLSREFFLATVLLHLHCLLFGVLGWVSVQHFNISADVRRAL
jgi:hypothetical protein